MKINNIQPAIYKPISFKSKESKSFGLHQLKADVFQRTTSLVEKAKQINQGKTEKDINKLYDEAFEYVISNMPILKELGIERPKLVFKKDINATAAYDFPTNTIEVNSRLKGDLFACHLYDSFDEVADCFINVKTRNRKISAKSKEHSIKCKTTKLNPQEKCLFIKSVLAHELRHWAQEHILASTKNCQEPYKHKLETVNEIISSLLQILDCAQTFKLSSKEINKYKKQLEEAKNQYSYILNYKPKIMFDENEKLAVSIIPWKRKYWSLKEHLLPAALRYSNSNDTEYNSNPSEIDAYYFQAQFILYNHNKKLNVREDVLQAMLYDNIRKGFFAIEKLEEFGYPPLIQE